MGDDTQMLIFLNRLLYPRITRWLSEDTCTAGVYCAGHQEWWIASRPLNPKKDYERADMLAAGNPGPFNSRSDAEAWLAWAMMQVNQ